MITLKADYTFPLLVCHFCLRAFDVSGEWSVGNQDPTGKVEVVSVYGDGVWASISAECPYCFETRIYREGEFWWAKTDESKPMEAAEAEIEALRKKLIEVNTRVVKLMKETERLRKAKATLSKYELEKANLQIKHLKKENARLADMAYLRISRKERGDLK